MVIEDHGHTKVQGQNNEKRNDKDDAPPPRLRRTKQASPQNVFLCFHTKTPHPFNIVRRARVIGSARKREQGGLNKNNWECYRGGSELYCGKLWVTFLFNFITSFYKFGENGFSSAKAVCKGVLIPTYCRVPRVGNTDEIQTAAAGQTGRTPKTID